MQLESFLDPMLNLNPDKRATAEKMLAAEWLQGVIVQGALPLLSYLWNVSLIIVDTGEIEVHLANEAKLNGGSAEEAQRIEQGRQTAQEFGMDVESPGVRNASVCLSTLTPDFTFVPTLIPNSPPDCRPEPRVGIAAHRRRAQH